MLQIIMILIMILITLWIFLGNFLVLYAFFRIRQIRSIDNMIIGSLSVTDFLLSISVAPLAIYNLAAPSEYRIFAPCLLWLGSDVFLSTVSIWHLCAISFERFYCVVFPLKFMYRRKKRVKLLIILSWLSGFFITIPLVLMAFIDKSTIYRTEVTPTQTNAYLSSLNTSSVVIRRPASAVNNVNINKTFKLDFQIEVYKPPPSSQAGNMLRDIVAAAAVTSTTTPTDILATTNNNCSYYNVYFSVLSVIFSYWFPMVVMLFLTSVTMIVLNRSKYRIDPRVKIKYMLKNKRRSTRLLVNAVAATAAVAHVKATAAAAAAETETVLLPNVETAATCSTTATTTTAQSVPKVSFRITNTNLTNAATQLLNTEYCDRRKGYFDFKFNDKIEETDFIDECFNNVDVDGDDDDDDDDDEDEDDEIDDDVIDDTTTAVAIAAATAIQLDEYTTTGISSSACQPESTIIVDLDTIATTNTTSTGKDDESKMFSRRPSIVMMRNKFNRFRSSFKLSTRIGNLIRQESCKKEATNGTDASITINEVDVTHDESQTSQTQEVTASPTTKQCPETLTKVKATVKQAKQLKQRNCSLFNRLRKLSCFAWFFNRLQLNRKKASQKSIKRATSDNTSANNKTSKNQAASRLMQYICKESEAQRRSLIVLIAFIVGYTPLFTLITVSWATNLQLNSNYFVALTWLGYLSSALNPSLYAWMNRNLKRAFYLIVTCKLNKKQSRPRTSHLLLSLNQNNSKAF